MDTKKLIVVFERYFDAKEHDHCIMLSGTWGSGKTYFVNDVLKPVIEKRKKKFIYISAYGLKSSEELEKAIFLAAYPLLKSGKIQALGAVLKSIIRYFKIDIEALLQVQASINENVVICIDDVERCDGDAVPAVLGVINSFVTQNKAKVILVCDETKLESIEKYRTWKEKVVGKTLLYKPSPITQLELLSASPIFQNHGSCLGPSQVIAAMGDIAMKGNCSNLRTLFKAFSDFIDIDSAAHNYKYFNDAFAIRILKTVTALAIEIHADASNANGLKELFLSKQFAIDLLLGQTGIPNVAAQFVSKYFENDYSGLVNSPFIFSQVVDGYIDDEDLQRYCSSSSSPNKHSAIDLLMTDFRLLDDAAFISAVNEVLTQIESGEIKSIETLRTISYFLFFFAEKRLISQEPHEVRRIFLEGIRRVENLLEGNSNRSFLTAFATNIGNEHREVLNQIDNLWQEQESARFNVHKTNVIKNLDSSVEEFCAELYALDRKLTSRSCFSDADAILITSKIRLIIDSATDVNRKITLIYRAFTARYSDKTLAARFKAEKSFVIQLHASLSELLENLETSLKAPSNSSDSTNTEKQIRVQIFQTVMRDLIDSLKKSASRM
ncbi:MAG TPA: P-loop NTPase fold protein [Noviherbaspirillum sp.]